MATTVEPTPTGASNMGSTPVGATIVESAPSTGGQRSQPSPAPVGGTSAQPRPASTGASAVYPSATTAAPSRRPLYLIGGGIAALACLVLTLVVGRFVFNNFLGVPPSPTETFSVASETSALTEAPAAVDLATETVAPTDLPTETAAPTLSPTPEGPYVVITEIRVEGNLYVVDYEPSNLESSQHVHIFFDTVPPEQAGSPGSGPWKLTWNTYGTPPFTQYGVANRPSGATQLCALVANANHSVILGSGNCVFLPE